MGSEPMRRTVEASAVLALVALVAGSCTAPPVAPEKPSWDLDVEPILRGNCSHCHGEQTTKIAPPWRFDVCDPAAMNASGVSPQEPVLGAFAASSAIVMAVDQGKPTKMPPAPAGTLSDYDATVLRNWAKVTGQSGAKPEDFCKKTGRNHDPRARLVTTTWQNGDLVATIDITDEDGDQVFTKVTAGTASADVLSVGRRVVTLTGASMGDRIVVKMSDGFNTPADVTISQ
jgi:hypothetical protein